MLCILAERVLPDVKTADLLCIARAASALSPRLQQIVCADGRDRLADVWVACAVDVELHLHLAITFLIVDVIDHVCYTHTHITTHIQ